MSSHLTTLTPFILFIEIILIWCLPMRNFPRGVNAWWVNIILIVVPPFNWYILRIFPSCGLKYSHIMRPLIIKSAAKWMNYCNAKIVITLSNLGNDGPRLTDKLRARCYINDRRPEIGTDTSCLRIGWNSFVNRLEMLKKVNFSWTNGISPHFLRQNLKKCFFIKQARFLC